MIYDKAIVTTIRPASLGVLGMWKVLGRYTRVDKQRTLTVERHVVKNEGSGEADLQIVEDSAGVMNVVDGAGSRRCSMTLRGL
jgi:hypothetical protein